MKEDNKNYDGWNNSIEKRVFDIELNKDIQLWKKAGMFNNQVHEM